MRDTAIKVKHPVLLAGGLVTFLLTASVSSQVGGDYDITKSTINGGGGLSEGGAYSVNGTIGQWEANGKILAGGEYQLAGGFWAVISDRPEVIFSDGFEVVDGESL